MTGHVLIAVVLFLAAAAVAARAIWVHRHPRGPGRHELDPELRQPSQEQVTEFLEQLPPWETAPRPATSDPSMLPVTPQWQRPPDYAPTKVVTGDITEVPARHFDGAPARVLPACSCGSYSHWQADHDTAASKLLDPQPEPATTLDVADSTFVKALFALPLDRVHEAFAGVRQ